RLKRYFGDKMSVGAQMVVVLKAFVEYCVSLLLGHPFEFSWLDVSQTDVFHGFLSLFPVLREIFSLFRPGPHAGLPCAFHSARRAFMTSVRAARTAGTED